MQICSKRVTERDRSNRIYQDSITHSCTRARTALSTSTDCKLQHQCGYENDDQKVQKTATSFFKLRNSRRIHNTNSRAHFVNATVHLQALFAVQVNTGSEFNGNFR